MRVHRKAAVLVLLGLSLGTPGVFAAKARSEGPPRPATSVTRSAIHASPLWNRFLSDLLKAGCTINPLGGCGTNSPSQILGDSGCTIDPLGHCLPGH